MLGLLAVCPEGHRLHVVLEGITRGFTAVNIRKFLLRAHRLSDLVALGSLTPQAARFLEASVRAGLNILVAGGTQAARKRGHCEAIAISAWVTAWNVNPKAFVRTKTPDEIFARLERLIQRS